MQVNRRIGPKLERERIQDVTAEQRNQGLQNPLSQQDPATQFNQELNTGLYQEPSQAKAKNPQQEIILREYEAILSSRWNDLQEGTKLPASKSEIAQTDLANSDTQNNLSQYQYTSPIQESQRIEDASFEDDPSSKYSHAIQAPMEAPMQVRGENIGYYEDSPVANQSNRPDQNSQAKPIEGPLDLINKTIVQVANGDLRIRV